MIDKLGKFKNTMLCLKETILSSLYVFKWTRKAYYSLLHVNNDWTWLQILEKQHIKATLRSLRKTYAS